MSFNKKLFWLGTILAFGTNAALSAIVLANPGFETSDGWTSQGIYFAKSGYPEHSGSFSLQMSVGGWAKQSSSSIATGDKLTFSGFVHNSSNLGQLALAHGHLQIVFTGISGNVLAIHESGALIPTPANYQNGVSDPSSWYEASVNAPSVPANATKVEFVIKVESNSSEPGNGYLYWDDFSVTVTPVPEPTNLALGILGSLGAIGLGWKSFTSKRRENRFER